MKTQKLYFSDEIEKERAYTIPYLVDEMKERDLTEITVFRAVREIGTYYFWCQAAGTCFTRLIGDPCGKECEDYEPRNGKSGCCKHRGFCYTGGDAFTLTVDGKLTKKIKP